MIQVSWFFVSSTAICFFTCELIKEAPKFNILVGLSRVDDEGQGR